MKTVGTFFGTVLAALLLAGPASAQSTLAPQDSEIIQRVEDYLETLTTVQARFVQHSQAGGFAQGTFYLSRPGRMRIEYDPPIPFLYVADGFWLTFWDDELKQRTDVPLGSTLADFLIREDVSLSGDVTVRDVRRSPQFGEVELDLYQTDDPGAGLLTLVFSEQPMAFKRWTVLDAQGLFTEVTLNDPTYGIELDNSLFRAPRPPRRPRDD